GQLCKPRRGCRHLCRRTANGHRVRRRGHRRRSRPGFCAESGRERDGSGTVDPLGRGGGWCPAAAAGEPFADGRDRAAGPARTGPDLAVAPCRRPKHGSSMTSGAGTVLVIDDQELVGTSLTYALASEGLDAHRVPVTSLRTVRQAAAEHVVGVALLDLELGTDATGAGLDGVELVGPLRAQGWTVLVVTGTAELDRVAAAVAAGAASW